MICIYTITTGAIKSVVSGVADLSGLYDPVAEATLDIAYPITGQTHYVAGGVLTERPAMPTTVTTTSEELGYTNEPGLHVISAASLSDKVTISNVPVGADCQYTWDGTNDVIDDGIIEFSAYASGVYIIRVSLFPYQDELFRIKVTL